jgi:hypothetical protein
MNEANAVNAANAALGGALGGEVKQCFNDRPATMEDLRKYVQNQESQRMRFEQRTMFLEWGSSDVPPLEYTVRVTQGAESVTISLLGCTTSIPLRRMEVMGKEALGVSDAEISRALCEMLGVSRDKFDATLKLEGFGNNGANVLIKPNVFASGKELKNNRPFRPNREFTLGRSVMCDLCGAVNVKKSKFYTVEVEGAPSGWPNLKVCRKKLCNQTDVLWMRDKFVRICKYSHGNKATGTVMGDDEQA